MGRGGDRDTNTYNATYMDMHGQLHHNRCKIYMTNPLKTIKQTFDLKYAAWELVLPEASLRDRSAGSINKNGWLIKYQYGSQHGQDYLEYFATHRMTNDTLNRIHADGREEILGYCQEFYEANNKQAEQAYSEHNRKFYEEVKRKGLWESMS